MKKSKKDLSLISPLALSFVSFIIGCALIIFDNAFNENICLYLSIMFYILAFVSCIIYFIARKKGDYEYLLLTLINVIGATILFVFQSMDNIMLGTSIVVFTSLYIFNSLYKIIILRKLNSFMWGVKAYGSFLILLLGALTSFNLYRQVTFAPLMLGYFFITFSIITSVESLIEIFVTENKFKKFMIKLFAKDDKLEEVEEEKVEPKKEIKVEKKEVKKTTPKKTTAKKAPAKKSTPKKTTTKKTTKKTKEA